MTIVKCKTNFGIPPQIKMCNGQINLDGHFEVSHYNSTFMGGNKTHWHFLCIHCNEYNTYTPDEVRKLKENKNVSS